NGDAHVNLQARPVRWQRRTKGQPQRNAGDRAQKLDEALDDVIDRPTVVARNAAEENAQHQRQHHTDQTNRHRNLRAINHARQQIAAIAVTAKQEQRRLVIRVVNTKQMDVCLNQPQQFVRCTMYKKVDRINLRGIGDIFHRQRIWVSLAFERIHKRAQMELAVFLHKLDGLWRRKPIARVVGVRVMRSQKFWNQRDDIQQQNEDAANHGHAMPPELPPHQLKLRGDVDAFLFRSRQQFVWQFGILNV